MEKESRGKISICCARDLLPLKLINWRISKLFNLLDSGDRHLPVSAMSVSCRSSRSIKMKVSVIDVISRMRRWLSSLNHFRRILVLRLRRTSYLVHWRQDGPHWIQASRRGRWFVWWVILLFIIVILNFRYRLNGVNNFHRIPRGWPYQLQRWRYFSW